jgi:hypothetical protein
MMSVIRFELCEPSTGQPGKTCTGTATNFIGKVGHVAGNVKLVTQAWCVWPNEHLLFRWSIVECRRSDSQLFASVVRPGPTGMMGPSY